MVNKDKIANQRQSIRDSPLLDQCKIDSALLARVSLQIREKIQATVQEVGRQRIGNGLRLPIGVSMWSFAIHDL